jgi:hypothetical protein
VEQEDNFFVLGDTDAFHVVLTSISFLDQEFRHAIFFSVAMTLWLIRVSAPLGQASRLEPHIYVRPIPAFVR